MLILLNNVSRVFLPILHFVTLGDEKVENLQFLRYDNDLLRLSILMIRACDKRLLRESKL